MYKNGRIMALTSTDAAFSTERTDPNHVRTESGTTDPRGPWHYLWESPAGICAVPTRLTRPIWPRGPG